VALLVPRRYLCNRSFVNFTYASYRLFFLLCGCTLFSQLSVGTLFETSVIEPDIVIPAVMREFFLVLDSTLAKYSGF